MDCPHRKLSPKGQMVHCQLVDIGRPIRQDPCPSCQSEWEGDKVPTIDKLPPTLLAMQKAIAGHRDPTQPVRLPPILVRMKNFALALEHHIANGAKILPKKQSEDRLAICDQCPFRLSVMGCRVCGVCGCALAVKATWESQRCPKLFWPGDKDKPPCGKPCGS